MSVVIIIKILTSKYFSFFYKTVLFSALFRDILYLIYLDHQPWTMWRDWELLPILKRTAVLVENLNPLEINVLSFWRDKPPKSQHVLSHLNITDYRYRLFLSIIALFICLIPVRPISFSTWPLIWQTVRPRGGLDFRNLLFI